MKTGIIEKMRRSKNGTKYLFKLKAANGNVVARSYPETYTQKHSAVETLESCFPDYKIVDKTGE